MNKYIKGQCISQIKHKQSDSPVLADLLKIREIYLAGRKDQIGNWRNIDFWSDKWCGNFSRREKFNKIYNICREQHGSVAKMNERRWHLSFRRWLSKDLQEDKRKLNDVLMTVCLAKQKDRAIWGLEGNRRFTVKSVYELLFSSHTRCPNNHIWKSKTPLTIKIFMWLVQQKVILTKDNLIRKKMERRQKKCFLQ